MARSNKPPNRWAFRLTTLDVGDDYLDVFRRPRFGFGQAKNPCIDCRVHLCRMACRRMQEIGASVVISGEILGQRPPGQRRKDLEVIAHHSGLGDRLLRPLSAKLLPETDGGARRLGRSPPIIRFSRQRTPGVDRTGETMAVSTHPAASGGCAAAAKALCRPCSAICSTITPPPGGRISNCSASAGIFASTGRPRSFSAETKRRICFYGNLPRNSRHGKAVFLEPKNFTGPSAIIVGRNAEAAIRGAAGLMLGNIGSRKADEPAIIVKTGENTWKSRFEETVSAESKRISGFSRGGLFAPNRFSFVALPVSSRK